MTEKRLFGAAVAAQLSDQRHVVGAKAQRAQQPRGGGFGGNLGAVAVLDPDLLAGLELAIELRRRAAELDRA